MQFLIAATFAVISLVGVVSPCPAVCSCSYGMVNCKYGGLSSIPTDIVYKDKNIFLISSHFNMLLKHSDSTKTFFDRQYVCYESARSFNERTSSI
jgi:hypothetical protein